MLNILLTLLSKKPFSSRRKTTYASNQENFTKQNSLNKKVHDIIMYKMM